MTLIVTIADTVAPDVSFAAYENISLPENPASGTYVKLPPPLSVSVPLATVEPS